MKHSIFGSLFRVLRITAVLLVLAFLARWGRAHLTSLSSEQAVINAQVLQIRTPIAGQLEFTDLRPGTYVKKGTPLLKVINTHFGDRATAAQANNLEAQVEALRGELVTARYTVDLERVTREQYKKLFASGAVSRMELSKAESRYQLAVELAKSKDEQLSQASRRSAEMKEQALLQRESVITMPTDGVIWAVGGKPGEQVETNHLVMEVINPENIWVDAFFAERNANELRPGQQVSVRSLDGAESWTGVLESVRAGVGRMVVDSTVAVPPPATMERQIAVRVMTAWNGPANPVEFCRVGRSVQVSFARAGQEFELTRALKTRWHSAIASAHEATASR